MVVEQDELEHERTVEREYGPNTPLKRRRVYGAILIAVVLGFLGMVLALFGNDNPRSFYGAAVYEGSNNTDPSVLWFVVKAAGLGVLALLIPWLASRKKPLTLQKDSKAG